MLNFLISITNAGPADPTVSDGVTYLTTSDNMDGWRAFYDASKNYSVDNNTKCFESSTYDYYGTRGKYQNIQATALTVMALVKENKENNE